MKELNLTQMEELNGGALWNCGAVAALGLSGFLAGITGVGLLPGTYAIICGV